MPFYTDTFSRRELESAEKYALRAAHGVQHILHENFGRASFRLKAENDFVTDYDLYAQDEILSDLRKFSHDIPIVAEENGMHELPKDTGTYWTIDPIDGTRQFIEGEIGPTTMISLVDNHVPVVGVIHDFVQKVTFSALAHTHGYESHGTKSFGSRVDSVQRRQHIVVPDLLFNNSLIKTYADVQAKDNLISEIESEGGVVLYYPVPSGKVMTDITKGELDGFVSLQNPYHTVWDVAPGALIVAMAGGYVQNIGDIGFDLRNPNFIAANRRTIHELQRIAGNLLQIVA